MIIVFFTKYAYSGPSSRYRVFQYLPHFKDAGFTVHVQPFFTDEYLHNKYNHRQNSVWYLITRYLHRVRNVLQLKSGTLVYVEYELAPYFPIWLEQYLKWRKVEFVVDYDDAIFHNYDYKGNRLVRLLFGKKIPGVMHKAALVITGSEYLTNFARKFNHHTIEIPTSISFNKYDAVAPKPKEGTFTIGWVGTPSSSKNVVHILPAIQKFLQQYPARLLLIGFDRSYKHLCTGSNIFIEDWVEADEIATMKSFDVGIMPLDDTPFNQGKCGFKLIQYMGCGLPTVFSPLKTNVNINKHNLNLAATTNEDWFNALKHIYLQVNYYKEVVGADNKQIVKKYYSTEANHQTLIDVFKQLKATCAE